MKMFEVWDRYNFIGVFLITVEDMKILLNKNYTLKKT